MGISYDANLDLESVLCLLLKKKIIMNTWTDFLYSMDSWWCSADWRDDSSAEKNTQLST